MLNTDEGPVSRYGDLAKQACRYDIPLYIQEEFEDSISDSKLIKLITKFKKKHNVDECFIGWQPGKYLGHIKLCIRVAETKSAKLLQAEIAAAAANDRADLLRELEARKKK